MRGGSERGRLSAFKRLVYNSIMKPTLDNLMELFKADGGNIDMLSMSDEDFLGEAYIPEPGSLWKVNPKVYNRFSWGNPIPQNYMITALGCEITSGGYIIVTYLTNNGKLCSNAFCGSDWLETFVRFEE